MEPFEDKWKRKGLEKKLMKEAQQLHREAVKKVRRGNVARVFYSIGVSLLWCGIYYAVVFRMQSWLLFLMPFILTLPIVTWTSKGR